MRNLLWIGIVVCSMGVMVGCSDGRAVKPPEGAVDTATNPSAVGAALSSDKVSDGAPASIDYK